MSRRRAWTQFVACPAVVVLLCTGPVQGDTYERKAFSLRFPAALSRFSPYADVAAVGGASGASKWGTSVNPASTGWLGLSGRLGLGVTGQYSGVCFSEGTKLHVNAESATWQIGEWGTLLAALAQVHSNRATTRQGLGFGYDMDLCQLQWGKRFGEKWALGAAVNFAKADARFALDDVDFVKSISEGYGLRLGGLCVPRDKWLIGLVFDYGATRSRTTEYDVFGLGLGDQKSQDTAHQFLLRPGISFDYKKESTVYVDYQFGAFCDETGRLFVHRFYAGVDHQLCEGIFARCGVAIDVEGRTAWTVGLGVYPNEWLTIDVGYQCDMFPELSPELGRSQVLTISLGIEF